MDFSRRDFMGMATAAMASGVATPAQSGQQMTINKVSDLRQDFPVLEQLAYLNSPYIAPSPQPVVDAAIAFLQSKASDPISLGSMLDEERAMRERFAELVNAEAAEIGVLSTTSEGENVVTAALDLQPGDNVVIDELHYDTTELLYDKFVETKGIEVRVVKAVDGAAPIEAFAQLVDDRTRVVSVSWVSHQNGFRHDLAALADIAHAKGAYLYVDAIQGVGALELDVRQTSVDFFTAGGYKWLLGGFGVALFYVRKELLDEIDMDRVGWRQLASETTPGAYGFHEDARKYGYATPSFGAVYQMRAALDYVLGVGVANIEAHVIPLANTLNNALRDLGFDVLTPVGNASQIVAFKHGVDPDVANAAFEKARVRASFREDGTQIRAGVGFFNNQSDVDRLLEVCASLRA
jgi:selenocysteine lyase/cysteine desulfurase